MSYNDIRYHPKIQSRIDDWEVKAGEVFPSGLHDDAEIWDIIDSYIMSLEAEVQLLRKEVQRAAITYHY